VTTLARLPFRLGLGRVWMPSFIFRPLRPICILSVLTRYSLPHDVLMICWDMCPLSAIFAILLYEPCYIYLFPFLCHSVMLWCHICSNPSCAPCVYVLLKCTRREVPGSRVRM
jgi:hypothetical protein